MNIVQILPALKEGGVETGTIDLCLALKKKGHRIIVISSGGPLTTLLKQHDIPHLFWPVHKKNPFTILRMSQKLKRFIKEASIDIVHARSRVPAWITFLARTQTQTKWVTTCHGYYRVTLASAVMGWGDKVIAPSDSIKRHMIEDFGVSKKKIVWIPRGVDLDKFQFSSPWTNCSSTPPLTDPTIGPTIGMIGRITPIKGLEDFLKALSLLKDHCFPFKAHIIGEAANANYYHKLLKLKDQLGLTDHVIFWGHQSDIAQCLKKIDLLVFPSVYPEAFGRVIIEAQATGIPVIATRLGGAAEIIEHGKTGFLSPPHDPQTLSHYIKNLWEHPQKTKKMIEVARIKTEQEYSKTQMVEKTESVYKMLVPPKKILVIKLTSLGDMVLISPSLRAIRQAFPASTIALLTDPASTEIVKHCPHIDEIIPISKRERKYDFLSSLKRLRERQFDISIDFQNGYLTHLISFFGRIPQRYGYSRKGGWCLLNHTPLLKKLPPVEHQFEILKLLNIFPDSPKLEFWISNENRNAILRLFDQLGVKPDRPLIGIHIGASWETKRWKAQHIAKFCDMIQTTGTDQVILTGSPSDKPFETEILNLTFMSFPRKRESIPLVDPSFRWDDLRQKRIFGQPPQGPVFSAVGKTTLPELGALIEKCRAFVSTDSVPLHIAAALGIPTLALFGPTDPNRHRPPSNNLLTLNEKVDCGPCYRSTCDHHSCMVKLDPTRVIHMLKEFSSKL